jgi:hypothetical protein
MDSDSDQAGGRYRLTIGELFPDGDLVAQWVFSATALVEDIQVGIHPTKEAQAAGDMRAMLFWHRHLVTRLYEARRLVTTARNNQAVRDFAGPLLRMPSLVDLADAYTRPEKGVPSTVERLYSEVRHHTVHYSHIGSAELRTALRDHANFPAQMTIGSKPDGATDVQFQWVQVVRGMEVFGDVQQADFLEQLQSRSTLTGAIAASWMMAAGLAVVLNAHRLQIDPARLGDVSAWEVPAV